MWRDVVKQMRSAAQPADANVPQPAGSSDATAKATAEEECFRAVVDLREVARKSAKFLLIRGRCQRDVKFIANSTAEQCMTALQASAG